MAGNESDTRVWGRPLSSSRAPFRLRLTAAQTGPKPILHYWYKVARHDYRRLCDDVPWGRGLRYNPPPVKECDECRSLRNADRQSGWGALSLTYILKGTFALSPGDELYVPPESGTNSNGNNEMKPTITVLRFSRFCVAGQNERRRIVEDLVEERHYPNPHAALRGMIQRTHWSTGSLDALIKAKPNIKKDDCDYARKMADAEDGKRDYIAEWLNREAEFFKVGRIDWPIGDLVIRVNPEVGMKTCDGAQALKVRFGATRLPDDERMIFHYLSLKAIECPKWPGWPIGIWEVRRRSIPLAPRLPDSIEGDVLSATSEFMQLYKEAIDRLQNPPSPPGP